MNDALKMKLDQFNAFVEPIRTLLFIARDSELQETALRDLAAFDQIVAGWKGQAVAGNDEETANILLGCECVLRFLHTTISMLLLLKLRKSDEAWDKLVDAQSAVADATRSSNGFSHLSAYAEQLAAFEHILFPPQVFLSAGMFVGRQECSICGDEYEDCRHLVGKPYWGKFCRRVLKDIQPDHFAIVEVPANKRCRVTHFYDTNAGGKRNRMTWRVEPAPDPDPDPDGRPGLVTEAHLLSAADLGLEGDKPLSDHLDVRDYAQLDLHNRHFSRTQKSGGAA